MLLFEAMRTTFSAREYTGEDVPDSILHEVLDNARFAPSGGNRQGARVVIVRDPKTKNALAPACRTRGQTLHRPSQGRRRSLEHHFP